jgi:DNA-binding transcriptional MerR regulator
MDNLKTLREICNILEVTRRAVQGYEKAGLVTPSERNKYGYLLYNEIEQERIKKIKLYQQFGFKLKEIKDLIDAPEYVVKEAVERQVSKLRSEITRLSTLIDMAEGLIEEFIK